MVPQWDQGLRRSRKALKALCAEKLPRGSRQQTRLVVAIDEAKKLSHLIKQSDNLLYRLFGESWREEAPDWSYLESTALWLAAMHRDIVIGLVPQLS